MYRSLNNTSINRQIIPNKDIIVISYDEYLNNFNETDIKNNIEFVKHIREHKYIVLCTQKSKSSSARTIMSLGLSVKHFQDTFEFFITKNNYKQIKKDSTKTPLSSLLTDNYSIRTRIFKSTLITNCEETITFDEIKNGSFRNYFRDTANKTALLCRINIKNNSREKIYNIINTDLFSLKYNSRPMYNDGLLYKQQQFLAIIKDFELYNKYAYGENIILAGSLKFNIYPLKMTNILNSNNRQKVNTYLLGLKDRSNKNKLKEYNELNKYLDKLINYYKKPNNSIYRLINNYEKKISNNIPENIKIILKKLKNNKKLNSVIPENIKTIINKYESEHQNIIHLLTEFKKNLVMNITGNSKHEMISSAGVGSIVKGSVKGTESLSRITGSMSKLKSNVFQRINSTRSNSTISAKDRILYALKNYNNEKTNTDYRTFDTNKKLDSTVINRLKNKATDPTQILVPNKYKSSFVNNKFITLSINYTQNNSVL
jgi:hypothetical protein